MAQTNYDAAAKSTALAAGVSGGTVVTRSNDTTYTISGLAAIVIKTDAGTKKADVLEALRAAYRAVQRDFQSVVLMADLPTSGDSVE